MRLLAASARLLRRANPSQVALAAEWVAIRPSLELPREALQLLGQLRDAGASAAATTLAFRAAAQVSARTPRGDHLPSLKPAAPAS